MLADLCLEGGELPKEETDILLYFSALKHWSKQTRISTYTNNLSLSTVDCLV